LAHQISIAKSPQLPPIASNKMQIDLSGKRAVVSGSTKGIGFAIAKGLAESGARVVINGRTGQAVKKAKDRILAKVPGAQVEGVAADLSTAAGCAALARAVPEADILVNNIGIFELKPFEDIPDADWMHIFETNVMSGVRLSRAYVPGMRKQNWGRIVFISSESAINIPVEMVQYGMTKTAQLAVSRGLAESLAGTGITVNAVLPGPTSSEGVASIIDTVAKQRGVSADQVEKTFVQDFRPSSIIQRIATVEEVANMVVYVCSPQASATTGTSLRVDGGVVSSIM
jgi:NAD(P)-dependent dehydrogenase (short-subunit alcohol dehydrogenase family)